MTIAYIVNVCLVVVPNIEVKLTSIAAVIQLSFGRIEGLVIMRLSKSLIQVSRRDVRKDCSSLEFRGRHGVSPRLDHISY